jgi:5-hydroxyisourate hydrolase
MSTLSTHVLDVSIGRPAAGLSITLEGRGAEDGWRTLGQGATDADGRLTGLLPPGAALAPGLYQLTFDTAAYFRARGLEGFYPFVTVTFEVTRPDEHYHVPLLLSPFGYSTYRGS